MSEPEQEQPEAAQPKRQRISIEIPADVAAVYANLVFISHTPAEVVLDFAQVLPRTAKGKVVARVIMSPIHAKLLHLALGQNLANFERQFGEIRRPRSLADELFSFDGPDTPADEK